jgi:Flp pilus assembly protein TadG
MKTMPMSQIWLRVRREAARLFRDSSGIAATEFAVIVPLMLVLFFGTVEFSSGVAVDRKVTLTARTLSDLTSQAPSSVPNAVWAGVDDNYLQNVFTASIAIVKPYSVVPTTAQISEIYVDLSRNATIKWSRGATIGSDTATQATLAASTHNPGDTISSVPAQLLVPQTYLIWSEVSYLYTPLGIGYVMKSNVTLSDVSYSRPRQATCVIYTTPTPNQPDPNPTPCPTTQ